MRFAAVLVDRQFQVKWPWSLARLSPLYLLRQGIRQLVEMPQLLVLRRLEHIDHRQTAQRWVQIAQGPSHLARPVPGHLEQRGPGLRFAQSPHTGNNKQIKKKSDQRKSCC